MKTNYNVLKTIAIALLFSCNSWSQTTLAQWNFNGTSIPTVPGTTSSPTVAVGSGTAELVGGVTATFASGVSSGGSSDPVTTAPDNYGWNTTGYAPQGTENKQRGVQFNVSTVGYQGVTFRFDQRLSNTSNNTYVVQYTTDRTAGSPVWVDAQTFTFTPAATLTGDVWYNLRSVDLTAVTALNDNANAAFRIVSAFDPGLGTYTASTSTSTYGTGGTSRFDMVTITAANLGTEQFSSGKNAFRISPNPSNKEIVNFSRYEDVQVYDASGKVILTAVNTKSIDTKSFTAGVYFIKTGTGLTTKLIVK